MSKPKTKETDWAALEANMLQYRKEHFAVEVTPDRHQPGQIVLSVTSNGKQWTSIGLLKGEVARVIEAFRTANVAGQGTASPPPAPACSHVDEPDAYIDEAGRIVIVGEVEAKAARVIERASGIPSAWIPLRRDHANAPVVGRERIERTHQQEVGL